MILAVKREVLEKLYADPVWSVKAARAKALEEFAKVVAEYCKIHGYKIKNLKEVRNVE